MDWVLENLTTVWVAFGFILLGIEVAALGMSTGFLLFAGIGALLNGLVLWANIVPATVAHSVGSFVVLTSLVTLLLWIPFKRIQSGSALGHDRSSDIIGHEFILRSDISQLDPGAERYSGIEWKVIPDTLDAVADLPAGTRVRVLRVDAGIFHVGPAD